MLMVRVPQQSATRSLSGSVVALSSLGYSESRQHQSYNNTQIRSGKNPPPPDA